MKTTTRKYYHQKVTKALHYIHKNSDKKLTLEEVAKEVGVSKFHFHRIFEIYMGITLSKYISEKRIENCIYQLIFEKNKTILQISIDNGYESLAHFNRQFKSRLKMTPSEYRKTYLGDVGGMLMTLSKDEIMEIKIEEIKPINVLFHREIGNYFESCSKAWKTVLNQLQDNEISHQQRRFFGIAHDNPHMSEVNEDQMRFDACFTSLSDETKEKSYSSKSILGGKYAIFEHHGPWSKLGETFHKIYGKWLYESGERLRELPAVIEYLDIGNFKIDDQKRVTLIYLPLQ